MQQTLEITEAKTLLDFLMDLLSDDEALAEFKEDPHGALKAAGLEDICVDDIKELLPTVFEKSSPEDCARYEDDCDENRCHEDHFREKHEEHHHGKSHDECHEEKWHDHEIGKVITHLTYVTNNYTIDNSINIGHVWTGGGDFVLVGGDNNGNIITGDDNSVVGDGAIVGDGNNSGNITDSGNTTVDVDVDADVAVDLGLGESPLPGFPDPTEIVPDPVEETDPTTPGTDEDDEPGSNEATDPTTPGTDEDDEPGSNEGADPTTPGLGDDDQDGTNSEDDGDTGMDEGA